MKQKERFAWEVRPMAMRENMVSGENYRFTVLTPNLLRLEYSPDGVFEDRASQVAFYRDFPRSTFTHSVEDGVLTLQTEALQLRYKLGEAFAEDTLSVKLLVEPASVWHFGEDFEDLGGTARTLDEVDGACPTGQGVCSRNGFSVVDDSESLLLGGDGWIELRQEGARDYYFFGYGLDYIGAVQALYRLTGVPPLLPAYALGNWWSRYYAYTQQEYLDLMDRFRQENIPLTVGVVDMDWHITQIPEEMKMDADTRLTSGWTGYSWNKELFPDYKAFLKELHKRGIKTSLNLHPAVGTCCHEDMYEQMAIANGIDPATKQRVPLNLLSKKHMETYFDILHHPYEADGVDFWWMDWQQGTDYWWIHEANKPGEYQDPRERMDPLWMLNHLHILDISRNGKRPMFFSRYSGPGSQRYPVGFSGDTVVTWDSLKFQPEFTATASNIGYCWWSHDIGGHYSGVQDDALYIRWLQYGVFSPINRLHSSNDKMMFKEPWKFPAHIAAIAGDWLRLRHRLFPYIYTMNYRTHTRLLPLVQPMYYSHPKCHEAYKVPTQFWFGSELMVSPVVEPNDPESNLGRADLWLPKGSWFDFFTGLHYGSKKGRRLEVFRELSDMPVFAKAGAIVPMACYARGENALSNADELEVLVFPGADNTFTLYEDAGDGSDYAHGSFVETEMSLSWGEQAVFTVGPARGELSLIPGRRKWRIGLRGFHKDALVTGGTVTRDPATNTTWVCVEADASETVTVTVSGKRLIHDNCDVAERMEHVVQLANTAFFSKNRLLRMMDASRFKSLRQQVSSFRGSGLASGKAMVELLTLTEDPYLGSQL